MQDQENTQAPETQDQAPAEELKTAAEGQPVEKSAEKPAENAASGEPSLEQQLANAVAKAAELQDAYLRAKAEGENIRRRAQEDIAKAHKFAIEGFAESMVPVKDSLEMALQVATPTIESLKEGVDMTLKQLSAAFEKNKLVEVNPKPGDKLDPMKHQAVSMVPAEQAANTVVTVLQKGYMIADRLLRPALVTVAQ
ncbi:MAG TPA: nucleotide exchange factor GrpE [Burkholderiaceae bacterium]